MKHFFMILLDSCALLPGLTCNPVFNSEAKCLRDCQSGEVDIIFKILVCYTAWLWELTFAVVQNCTTVLISFFSTHIAVKHVTSNILEGATLVGDGF